MLEEGALDLAQGAEEWVVSSLRAEKARSQPLAGGDKVTAPCFPGKRAGSGKKGEHALSRPEQFTDWTERSDWSLSRGRSLESQPPGPGRALASRTHQT